MYTHVTLSSSLLDSTRLGSTRTALTGVDHIAQARVLFTLTHYSRDSSLSRMDLGRQFGDACGGGAGEGATGRARAG